MQLHSDKLKNNEIRTAAGNLGRKATVSNTALQLKDNRPRSVIQKKLVDAVADGKSEGKPIQLNANKTGLPGNLKSGIENLSGFSMNDVKVHYHSSQPAQLNAHAYAQGTDIHIAPGQEKHLSHEAWHVVQQKQGRVKSTMQLKSSIAVNEDESLEKEAVAMGIIAGRTNRNHSLKDNLITKDIDQPGVAQLVKRKKKRPSYYPGINQGENFFKRLRKVAEPKRVFAIHEIAMKTIDGLLPQILGALPFESASAAINFGQEVVIKWLTYSPQVLEKGNLANEMKNHLAQVISALPLAKGEEDQEDEDGDEDDDSANIEKKPEGKADPRYIDARSRFKKKMESEDAEDDPEIEYFKKQSTERTESKQQLLAELHIPSNIFLTTYFTGHSDVNAFRLLHIIKYAKEGSLTGEDLLREYNLTLNKSGILTNAEERLRFCKELVNIKALPEESVNNLYKGHFESSKKPAGSIAAENQEPGSASGDDPLADLMFFDNDESDAEDKQSAHHGLREFDENIKTENERNSRIRREFKDKKEQAKKARDEENEEKSDQLIAAINNEDKNVAREMDVLASNPFQSKDSWSVSFLDLILKILTGRIGSGAALTAYEDLFAAKDWPPGNENRVRYIASLDKSGLLAGVDKEVLELGTKSAATIIDEAVKGGWITRHEIEIGNKLLGPGAFAGIVASHMKREKPGPLRGMLEQLIHNRHALLAPQPKLTSQSLVVDTNLVELIATDIKDLIPSQKKMRNSLIKLIQKNDIRDIRLANINIAELHSMASLIGKKIKIRQGKWVRSLNVFGIPVSSRGSQKYDSVFQQLEQAGVGERKGNADRSMIADIYMGDRASGRDDMPQNPHLATADLGITKKIGKDEGQFDPEKADVGNVNIHTVFHAKPSSASTEEGNGDGEAARKPLEKNLHIEREVVKEEHDKSKDPILDYRVGKLHTVADLINWIEEEGYKVYIVGGAVRDKLRQEKINDVDIKTNMPLKKLHDLLDAKKTPVTAVTLAIRLIKAGSGDHIVDITCTKSPESDLIDDQERDFTVNAMRMSKDGEISGPPGSKEHTKTGLLRFIADPGPEKKLNERVEAVIGALKKEPELLGRALKFIERGYQNWSKKEASEKNKEDNEYHLEAEILDAIRENAVEILKTINEDDLAAGKKSIFIHKTGFRSPMAMVRVMSRLNFPARAIQLVIPDSIAGKYDPEGLKVSFSRNVSPRDRAVGPVSAFNPKAAPKMKVDTTTGAIYQYRFYAIGHHDNLKGGEKLLIDVDYTEHGTEGHPSPHYHIFRDIQDRWFKNASGFSRTGQPGLPSTKKTKTGTVYTGPMPWTWVKNDAAYETIEDNELIKEIRTAAKKAGLPFTLQKKSGKLSIGKELTLHIAQLRDVAKADLSTKLLALIHNLEKRNVPWNPKDQSVREFTSGKSGKVRFRFASQLKMVDHFLTEKCKLPMAGYLAPGKLSDGDRARLFDLVNANIPDEQCVPAASYAIKHAKSPRTFVEHFEFFLEATKNQVELGDIHDAHKKTLKAARKTEGYVKAQNVGDVQLLAEYIKAHAHNLGFENISAAAYHLVKHADMVFRSTGQKVARIDFNSEEAMSELADKYIEIARSIVAQGKLSKTEHDSDGAKMFTFKRDGMITFVRVSKAGNAFLLSSFDRAGDSPIRLALSFLDEQSKMSGKVLPGYNVFNTAFGRVKRLNTGGSGNCLYDAINVSGHLGKSIAGLRQAAAAELKENWFRYDYRGFIVGPQEGSLQRAQNEIRENGAWNTQYGDISPMLVGSAFKRPIHILSSRTGALISTQGRGTGKPIIIFYNGTDHYSASQIL